MAAINILHDQENVSHTSTKNFASKTTGRGLVTSKSVKSLKNDMLATPRKALGDVGNVRPNQNNKPFGQKLDATSVKKAHLKPTVAPTPKLKQRDQSAMKSKPKNGFKILATDDKLISVAKQKPTVDIDELNDCPLEKEIMHVCDEDDDIDLPDYIRQLSINPSMFRCIPPYTEPVKQAPRYSFNIDDYKSEVVEPLPMPELPSLLQMTSDFNIEEFNNAFPLDPIEDELDGIKI